jgi:glycosyltransferase involved in cell wall biosynthesis
MDRNKSVLLLVENNTVPFDRRVWLEATTLRDAGYHVSVICPTDKTYKPGYEYFEGIHIYRFNLPATGSGFSGYLIEYFIALVEMGVLSLRVLVEQGFDVVHTANPPDILFLICLIFRVFHKKIIFDFHDLSPEIYKIRTHGKENIVFHFLKLFEYFSIRSAHVVIATNQTYANRTININHKPPDKVFVVRTAPDSERMKVVPPNALLKKGAKYMLCYIGVMGPQDGVDYALMAFDWLVNKQGFQNIHFTLIGFGEMVKELNNFVIENHLENYVTFTGRITENDKLLEYLYSSDICITPDPLNGLNENNTLIKTLEYMASGKPQVAFDLYETRFTVGESGLYAKPNSVEDFGKKILELINDPQKCKIMGERGRRRIMDDLNWDKSKAKLLEVYEKLVGLPTRL